MKNAHSLLEHSARSVHLQGVRCNVDVDWSSAHVRRTPTAVGVDRVVGGDLPESHSVCVGQIMGF